MDPQTLSAVLVGAILIGASVGTLVLMLVVVKPGVLTISEATVRMMKKITVTIKAAEMEFDPPFAKILGNLDQIAKIAEKLPVLFDFLPDSLLTLSKEDQEKMSIKN